MTLHGILLILTMSVVTIIIRFLPFILFRDKSKMPTGLIYLGNVLPGAVMGMLVIYCFRNVSILTEPFGLPELIAAAVTVVIHLIKRNVLISIAAGTILYMLLIQLVF